MSYGTGRYSLRTPRLTLVRECLGGSPLNAFRNVLAVVTSEKRLRSGQWSPAEVNIKNKAKANIKNKAKANIKDKAKVNIKNQAKEIF